MSLEDEDAEEGGAEDEKVLNTEVVELSVAAVLENPDVSVELGLADATGVPEANVRVEVGAVEELVGVLSGMNVWRSTGMLHPRA